MSIHASAGQGVPLSKPTEYDATIRFVLPSDMKQAIEKLARARRMSVGAMIRQLIIDATKQATP